MAAVCKISKDNWEVHKPQIRDLYITEKKSLAETIGSMARNHDFRPTLVHSLLKPGLV